MSAENNEEIQEEKEKSAPCLPNGIGLTMEGVRNLLLQRHNANVPVDDPILMVVTIMNAALTEQEKLQKSHREALGKLMNTHAENYISSTKAGMTEIMKTLSKLTTDGLNEAAKDMVKYRMTMLYCTAITFVSSMLIVGAFVLGGM